MVKKFLPSKKFLLMMGIGLGGIIVIFLIFFFLNKKEFFNAKSSPLEIDHQTVNGLLQTDSDNDGVPDWEESLWGTDIHNPVSFDGIPDATYVANKKKILNISSDDDNATVTETDKFAREFFAAFTAMKATGKVDNANINNFSSALGQKVTSGALVDEYSLSDVKEDAVNTISNQKKYYSAIQKLFDKYKAAGLGDELVIIGGQLSDTSNSTTDSSGTDSTNTTLQNSGYGPVDSNKLLVIAQAYQDFAKDLMLLAVPTSLKEIHLQIANAANNTGLSVANMTKVTSDPIVGLSGLSQYQKYSDALITAATNLKTTIFK